MKIRPTGLKLITILCAAAFVSPAATITLNAIDSGYYLANGTHNPSLENYLTGFTGTEYRSFFVFDLSSVSGTINSATLRLFNPEVSQFLHGYVSPDPSETLNFYDVTTPAAAITGNAAGIAGFNDLGSGTLYGSRSVSAANNGTVIETALNSSAIAAMSSANGLFLLGGAVGTVNGPSDQYVFGFSMVDFVPDHTRQLVLDFTSVPEPSTASLALFGTILVLARGADLLVRGRRPRRPC